MDIIGQNWIRFENNRKVNTVVRDQISLFQDVFLIGGLGITRRKDLAESKIRYTFALGEMAEWSIAAVLKTVELRGSGGSNPSLSAINAEKSANCKMNTRFYTQECKIGCFCII